MNQTTIQTREPEELLSPWRRLRYKLTPKRLYAHYRASRDLRRYETEMHLLPFLVDRNRNAIDAGANRGSYCYFLARLCPKVFAYEPNPVMREYLSRVVQPNVRVIDAALSDHPGAAEFCVPYSPRKGYRNTSGTLETELYSKDSLRFQVRIARLDDEPVTNIGFIKMDIEGHELKALEGARQLIQRDRPTMMIEVREELNGTGLEEALQFIGAFGYDIFALCNSQLCNWRMLDQALLRNMPAGPRAKDRLMNFIFFPRPAPKQV